MKHFILTATVLTTFLLLSFGNSAIAGKEKPQLGVFLMELHIDGDAQEKIGYDGDGIQITEVIEGSGADDAGLLSQDVIVEFDGKKIDSILGLKKLIGKKSPGDKVTVKYIRDGKKETVDVELKAHKKGKVISVNPKKWVHFFDEDRAWMGIELHDLGDQLANHFKVKSGVLVAATLEESPAKKAGMKAGDVIIKWDDEKIEDSDDEVKLVVMRDGKRKNIKMTLGEKEDSEEHFYKIHINEEDCGDFNFQMHDLHRLNPFHEDHEDHEDHKDNKELEEEMKQLRKEIEQLRQEIKKN
ncbi:MAG: hypothetical protein B6244_01550 [Candidatus Cloacimonetes bacterium 4572_55]|nr:MAG: hypothetical protein B6244_01550 [Candidatus Cloacimonetes bacterium 4572_55]